MSKRRLVIVLIVGISISLMGWLASSFRYVLQGPAKTVQVNHQKSITLIKLNVRLGWLVNANSAGQIAALAEGFYREEGLDITFNEGGIADPSVKTVAAGADDLGFANGPDLVISARAAGAPLKILAVIQRDGYHSFFVREDSGILTPKDWIGRRVGIKVGSPTYLYYLAILNKLGIGRASIHEVPLGYDVSPFLTKGVDVFPGAKNNEAITIEALGVRLRFISPADYGIQTMGNVLFTTETMLLEREDAVRRFVRATMRGWDWCQVPENQDAVINYLIAYNPKLERVKEKRALEETLPLVDNGSIDRNKLADIIDNQLRYGGLSRRVTVEELIAPILPE
jgi:ABC-type nitrate/sulfonate/bicarbonate transport system substrate-binding protein